MSEILGFAYFVFGGLAAGRVLHAMWSDGIFEVNEGEERPFFALLLLAGLFWLAWPIVWGIHRAMRAPTPAGDRDG